SPLQPFQMVYALFEHQYLGHIFESFVIQVNTRGQLTYQYQNVSHKNIDEFAANIDKDDIKLVHWMDEMQQEAVAKKFNKKKLKIVDFFLKTYDKDKGDKQLQAEIDTYMEHCRSLILPKLMNKKLFIMGKDGNPIWQPIEVSPKIAQVYFHFDRQEEQTLYYPNILADGERVKFQFKKSRVICEEPAFLLVDTTLYRFKPHTDGKKIKPFLERNNIVISRKIEEKYFKNFVAPLIGQFKVYAKGIGFTIQTEELPVRVQLVLTENRHQLLELAIGNAMEEQEFSTSISLELQFVYGDRVFPFQNFTSHAFVEAIQENEAWTFLKIPRNTSEEKRIVQDIAQLGLPLDKGAVTKNVNDAFTWLQKHALYLEELGVQIIQRETSGKNYFLGHAAIRVEIEEKNDWFDIKTKIRFGEFEIAFVQLRKIMKAGRR
ncbi:MAG: ATP-dependent helicase, partial [Spirosomataceae bacterium]